MGMSAPGSLGGPAECVPLQKIKKNGRIRRNPDSPRNPANRSAPARYRSTDEAGSFAFQGSGQGSTPSGAEPSICNSQNFNAEA